MKKRVFICAGCLHPTSFLFENNKKTNIVTDLNLIIFSNPFQLTLVFVYCFFYVVHFRAQADGLVHLLHGYRIQSF